MFNTSYSQYANDSANQLGINQGMFILFVFHCWCWSCFVSIGTVWKWLFCRHFIGTCLHIQGTSKTLTTLPTPALCQQFNIGSWMSLQSVRNTGYFHMVPMHWQRSGLFICKMSGNQLPYGPTPSNIRSVNNECSWKLRTCNYFWYRAKVAFPAWLVPRIYLWIMYTCSITDTFLWQGFFPIRKANSKQCYILLFIFLLFIACNGVILLFFLTNICTYSIHRDTVSQLLVHLSAATHRHQGVYMCIVFQIYWCVYCLMMVGRRN